MSVNSCLEWWCNKSKNFRLFLSPIIVYPILIFIFGAIISGFSDVITVFEIAVMAGLFGGVLAGIWLVICFSFWNLAINNQNESWKRLLGAVLLLILTLGIGLIQFFLFLFLFVDLPCMKYSQSKFEENNED